MGLAARHAAIITARSRLVVVCVLLLTALVAAGAVLDEPEDGGIGEFETDSDAEAALEVVEDRYETDDRVVSQLVVRSDTDGDNAVNSHGDHAAGDVLTRESLLESLHLQQAIRADADRNATLEEIVGLENVVSRAALADDLEDEADALDARSEALEEQREDLEARLTESRELQREYEALNASAAAGELDAVEYEERAGELEDELAAVEADAAAELDDDQREAYADAISEARELEAAFVSLERAAEAGELEDEAFEAQAADLEEALEGVTAAGTVGVLEAEFDALEERGERLEDGRNTLEDPTLADQIEALESRSDDEVEALLADVLDPDADLEADAGAGDAGGQDPYEFFPTAYAPGSTTADARITLLFQADESGPDEDPERAYGAQLEVDELIEERFGDEDETGIDAFLFGQGITDEASANAVGDSFGIITPVALVLVLFVLGVTYRDVIDVLLGLFGLAVVMVWLAGLLGWLGIATSQLLIAVPFLLIGLGVDYSLHVVMRYREARAGMLEGADADAVSDLAPESAGTPSDTPTPDRGPQAGMALGLAGVVLALAAATFSTGVGFLSNYVSPLPAIQDFALLSAGGIFGTFVAFGVLVPALKVEVDTLLEERFDRDRRKRAFGVETGGVNRVLEAVVGVVSRAPLAVIAVALVLAVGGAYGATGIDTEFNEADFLPEDAPDWAQSLPEPLAPDRYTVAEEAEYIADTFAGQDTEAQILLTGEVTDPETLAAIDAATADLETAETVDVRADGEPAVDSPLSVLEDLAATNGTVADGIEQRDTTGDGLPDSDLEGLYNLAFDADDDAMSTVISRAEGDGSYDSARLVVSVRGDASAQAVAEDSRALETAIEANGPVTATATGGPVINAVIQDALLETLVQAFAVTLVVIGLFLTVLYWLRHRALTLGVITLAPVVIALAWLLGAMALLEIPFNSETAVITSLAIGLGVDYSIHLSERFVDETDRRATLEEALSATITGTGGALLGSAATTAAGFGVLALALAPPLQRFGLVTGLAIIFAFVACLTVLPSLLMYRARVRKPE